jgi:hypothetical protein
METSHTNKMKIINLIAIFLITFPCLAETPEPNKIETRGNNSPAIGTNTGNIRYDKIQIIDSCVFINENVNAHAEIPQNISCNRNEKGKASPASALDKAKLAILIDDNKTHPSISDAHFACWLHDKRTFVNLTFSNDGNRPALGIKYGDEIRNKKNIIEIKPYSLPQSGKTNGFFLEKKAEVSLPFISIDDIVQKINLRDDETIYAVSTDTKMPDIPMEIKNCSMLGAIQVPKSILNVQTKINNFGKDELVENNYAEENSDIQNMYSYHLIRNMYSILVGYTFEDIFGGKHLNTTQFHVFTYIDPH